MYIFSHVSLKIYVVGTHWKCLREALPMSTHNIFWGAWVAQRGTSKEYPQHILGGLGGSTGDQEVVGSTPAEVGNIGD